MSQFIANKQIGLFGGLQAKNLNDINPKFICSICKLLLLYPYQILCCGTVLCKWCMKKALSNSEPFLCQFCGTKQAKKQALPDRGIERELKIIIIVCYSCSWNGTYQNYLEHCQKEHADFECLDCHERFITRNSLEEHRQEFCVHRCLTCELPNCRESVKWDNMKSHYLSGKHQQLLLMFTYECINQQSKTENTSEVMQKEFHEIHRSIDTILSVLDVLYSDQNRLKSELDEVRIAIEAQIVKINEVKQKDNDTNERIKKLATSQTNSEIELDNIKQTFRNKQILVIDSDLTMILRFDYSGVVPFSINSMKFKTSEYGYVFTIRVCSTKQSDGEYLSIFLTLHSGEFDNLIPFPFSYNIHLSLLDQSNQNQHIEHILKPDLKSSAVNRPTDEHNDEYGIVKFCPIYYLTDPKNAYVKDGQLFLRIVFDLFE
ncbi:hypothetical protein I4U23_022790 [Adineta vaga]|nr:hypothetical protein I4U23_022790 [Adineta vaga]